MKKLPDHLKAYKKTNVFCQDTIPKGLLNDHSTQKSVWGKICVLEGELHYIITESGEDYTLTIDRPGIVEPEVTHKVVPIGNVRFYVEFYKA